MRKALREVGTARGSRRSVFNLSYSKVLTGDFGYMYPVLVDEVIPGDVWKIGFKAVFRFMPLVAPILHEVNLFYHVFFVPNRILDDGWETFITGWNQSTNTEDTSAPPMWQYNAGDVAIGSLGDHLGFVPAVTLNAAFKPVIYPVYAYNLIYNEYYRDQWLSNEIDITANFALKKACWEKDYFTSALLTPQKGTTPAVPLGSSSAQWTASEFSSDAGAGNLGVAAGSTGAAYEHIDASSSNAETNLMNMFNKNTVDMSASSLSVNDLRLVFQTQRWLERNARAGSRYPEWLRAHHNVDIGDARINRPEYIGGSRTPIVISQVLQQGSDPKTTPGASAAPVGDMRGHGIAIDSKYIGTFRAPEYGIMMGIVTVKPRTAYHEGINRQWIKRDKYDYFQSEFVNLGEQAVENGEVFVAAGAADATTWGYQGRYNELRYKENMVAGEARPGEDFETWTLTRDFGSLPALDSSFVEVDNTLKRHLQDTTKDGWILQVGHTLKVARPIPVIPNPGLIDHI